MAQLDYDLLCPRCHHVSKMPTFHVYLVRRPEQDEQVLFTMRVWTFGEAVR